MRFVVGTVSEIPPGARKIVYPSGGQGIGIFNVGGRFYALKNVCPHQGAQLCLGRITGTATVRAATPDRAPELEWTRNGELIACPWHHWEFEISTGKTVFPSRKRVSTYEVTVEQEIAPGLLAGVETYPVNVEDEFVIVQLPDR